MYRLGVPGKANDLCVRRSQTSLLAYVRDISFANGRGDNVLFRRELESRPDYHCSFNVRIVNDLYSLTSLRLLINVRSISTNREELIFSPLEACSTFYDA